MKPQEYNEEEIPAKIAQGDLKAYEFLFRQKYEVLYQYSAKITAEPQVSEEIVQDVFVSLWAKRKTLSISSTISNYLFRAVKNKSIDYLRSKYAQIQKDFTSEQAAEDSSVSLVDNLEAKDLEVLVTQAIEQLPKKCKEIFLLSREGGLTYEEIAQALGVSHKTVKAQMGIALKKLRTFLDTYWGEFILLIISFLEIFYNFF